VKRPTLTERLSRFGLVADSWVMRRESDNAVVAWLSPPDAESLVDHLERGMSLDHALRAVRAVAFRSTSHLDEVRHAS